MSNEKKADLVAVHEVRLGADTVIAPGKTFSADAKTADYLLSIGAAKKKVPAPETDEERAAREEAEAAAAAAAEAAKATTGKTK